jgi:ATP-dependent Lon protease
MGEEQRSATEVRVPFLPLRGLVAFPHEEYPIYIGRKMSINAIDAAESQRSPILLVAQKDPKVPKPAADDMYSIGTLGSVTQVMRLPDGTIKALIDGKKRARVKGFVFEAPYFSAAVEEIDEGSVTTGAIEPWCTKLFRRSNSTCGAKARSLRRWLVRSPRLTTPACWPIKSPANC